MSTPIPAKSHGDAFEAKIVAELSPAQYETLFRNAVRRRFARNAVIYAPGDRSTTIHYVVRGRVKIYDVTGDGREIIYRFCEDKSMFGLSALFGGDARPVFAQAVAETDALVINRANFERLILQNPSIAVATIHILGHRLRQAHAAITEFVVGDVRSRLAQLLIKFAETASSTRDGVVAIEGRFTHQEIANMIGATRSTVTKVMNEWKRRAVVRVVRGRISIPDYDALARLLRH